MKHQAYLRYRCCVSFLEVSNDAVVDLLNPAAGSLAVRDDARRGCYVEGLEEQARGNIVTVVLAMFFGGGGKGRDWLSTSA